MPRTLPPGPSQHPILQMRRYLKDPLALFEECGARHGDIFTLRLGPNGTWVFVASPDLVRELYMAPPEVFRAGEAKASIFGPVVGTTSSLVLDGDAHLRRRKLPCRRFTATACSPTPTSSAASPKPPSAAGATACRS